MYVYKRKKVGRIVKKELLKVTRMNRRSLFLIILLAEGLSENEIAVLSYGKAQ